MRFHTDPAQRGIPQRRNGCSHRALRLVPGKTSKGNACRGAALTGCDVDRVRSSEVESVDFPSSRKKKVSHKRAPGQQLRTVVPQSWNAPPTPSFSRRSQRHSRKWVVSSRSMEVCGMNGKEYAGVRGHSAVEGVTSVGGRGGCDGEKVHVHGGEADAGTAACGPCMGG